MSTLKDIARIVSDRYDIPQQASEQFISAMFDVVKDQLTHDELVKIKGLGTFKVQNVPERASVDVNTGEKIVIDSHDRMNFTPDNSMKDSVNKPFSHFETVVINDGVVFDDLEGDKENDKQNDKQENKPSQPERPADHDPVQVVNLPSVAEEQPVKEATPIMEVAEKQDGIKDTSIEILQPEVKVNKAPIEELTTEDTPIEKTPTQESTMEETPTEDMKLEDNDKENPILDDDSRTSTVVTVLLAILVFVVGVVIGRATADISFSDIKAMVSPSPKPAEKTAVAYKSVKKASSSSANVTKADTLKQKPKADTPATTNPSATTSAQTKNSNETTETLTSKYDSDPRIRLGAYRITGVAQTVTVKEGQSLESISKTYLGPGMECYVEAVNGGIKEVTAGQKIKIPSLQVKKRKK